MNVFSRIANFFRSKRKVEVVQVRPSLFVSTPTLPVMFDESYKSKVVREDYNDFSGGLNVNLKSNLYYMNKLVPRGVFADLGLNADFFDGAYNANLVLGREILFTNVTLSPGLGFNGRLYTSVSVEDDKAFKTLSDSIKTSIIEKKLIEKKTEFATLKSLTFEKKLSDKASDAEKKAHADELKKFDDKKAKDIREFDENFNKNLVDEITKEVNSSSLKANEKDDLIKFFERKYNDKRSFLNKLSDRIVLSLGLTFNIKGFSLSVIFKKIERSIALSLGLNITVVQMLL